MHTERNWSVLGRVCTASKSSLSQEHAKKLITICSQAKAQLSADREFEITMQVVENDGGIEQEE